MLLDNRDLLFKLSIEIILLYIYLINNIFYSILVRNNFNESILISRYLRLDLVSKINYDNYYYITFKIVELAIVLAKKDKPYNIKELIATR